MGIHDEKTEETRFGKVEIYQGVKLEVQCLPAVHTSDTSFNRRCSLNFFFFIIDYKNSELTESYCAQDYGFLQWKKNQIKVNQWKRFMMKCPKNF